MDVGNGTLRYRVRKRVVEQRRILRGDVDDEEEEEEEVEEEEDVDSSSSSSSSSSEEEEEEWIFVTVFP